MEDNLKKNLTFFTIGLIFMLSGIEYGKPVVVAVIEMRLSPD